MALLFLINRALDYVALARRPAKGAISLSRMLGMPQNSIFALQQLRCQAGTLV